MELVQAKDLTKRFNDFIAVDHVSLDVKRGEVVGFLGPNGAGKSTTMKMISGFLEPDEGTISICGHDVLTDPIEAKRRIGYLPEGAPAYSDMTVADFLDFVGRMRGLSGAELKQRLAEMVDRIKIADVWNRRIENLSKGFKRRVGIAQALIHDPDILILDEPTDGLDPNQKHEMRELVRKIAPEKAIIISTHILEEVDAVCSRAVIIADGKVVADETPHALTERAKPDNALQITVASIQSDLVMSKVQAAAVEGSVELLEQVNGSTRVLIRHSGDLPKPSKLIDELAKSDIEVEDISQRRASLEDVFRQITQQQTHR